LRAILYVPLGVDGERYGVFTLAISESDRTFTDADEQLATLIAQRASIAVGNARLYERQREVARTLQAAFLPPALPRTDGVRFDAAYVPGTRDLTVGGDWYDAFPYADGAFAFSVGDVAGHGLDAAVPMGKMRQTFRALAAVETDPARALGGADAVLRGEHPDIFVTAFVATYDVRGGVLRYANAGHPSPFVRLPDGRLFRLESGGIPLGLGAFDALRTQDASLGRGDLLVAFTDGLIEATHDIDEGEATVARALAHPAFGFCSQPATLLRTMVVQSLPRDDVAILTLRTGGGADWTFDANDARAAQAAREAFVARLAAERASHDDQLAYEIVFGEIVGNAARYTPGPLELALRRDGARLVLFALDRGPGFDWDAALPRDAYAESGRGLFLIATLACDVRAEHLAGYGAYLEVTLARG
jgi:serine phosphatase RsbU (regulator of sigma subunit)/anti-sigma regulatory factor (Ser/Thr protein kinase)